ncbi:YALIA101S03e22320g1_1 [Yarrowia lipolytica]|jgi:hypothetical protein|nr:Hypothetical protein YALI2_E00436g [Yarrowia lipolytica]SEI33601.1 YALIA101S03e22320g1_1 [Yarrowia lipolytica]VBB78206.1 Hypothetical protein conserved in the Yarrowia clade [Yarrowia lipolytica]
MSKLEVLQPHSVGKRIASIAVSGTLAQQQRRIEEGTQRTRNQLRTRQKDFSRPTAKDTYFAGVSKETRFIDTYTARLRQSHLTLLFECPVDWQLVNEGLDPTEDQVGLWRAHVRNTQAWVLGDGKENETAEALESKLITNQQTQVVHKSLFAGTLKCIEYDDPALDLAWTAGNDINKGDSMALRVQRSPSSIIALFLSSQWNMEQAAKLFDQKPHLPLLGAIMSSKWNKHLEEASEFLSDEHKPPKGQAGALADLLRRLSHYGLTQSSEGLADYLYLSRAEKKTGMGPDKTPEQNKTEK